MGACASGASSDPVTARIDAELRRERDVERDKVKLLLLGTGESGKTTIFKQMKILYGKPYTAAELEALALVIRSNCAVFISALAAFCEEQSLLPLGAGAQAAFRTLLAELGSLDGASVERNAGLCVRHAAEMKEAWASDAMKKAWARRGETGVIDGARARAKRAQKKEVVVYVAYVAYMALG
jgi:hypothetical protein